MARFLDRKTYLADESQIRVVKMCWGNQRTSVGTEITLDLRGGPTLRAKAGDAMQMWETAFANGRDMPNHLKQLEFSVGAIGLWIDTSALILATLSGEENELLTLSFKHLNGDSVDAVRIDFSCEEHIGKTSAASFAERAFRQIGAIPVGTL